MEQLFTQFLEHLRFDAIIDAAAFQQIAADLAHQYVLSYYPGSERPDGRFPQHRAAS